MPDALAAVLGWVVPAAVVFVIAALGLAIAVWAVRRARRSPRARAAAEQLRAQAGIGLVRLDDAVDDLELEVGLSGALYGGTAPSTLRRARMTAQHVRDQSFEEYRAISGEGVRPDEVRRAAARIERRTAEALARIAAARGEHAAWVAANVSAAAQVESATGRLARLRAEMGDPQALVAELSGRFDQEEWADAAQAATAAASAADAAEAVLHDAASRVSDPSRSVLPELAEAERSLRRSEADSRVLEETHRLVTQAAQALPGEFDAARAALRQATLLREHLEPADSTRLGSEVRALSAELDTLEVGAARRPTRAIDAIARVRDRLDMAVGDAHTAQQRLRGARTALPGTLAAARAAIAHAESAVVHSRAGADARARLISAQRELAAARQADDPVGALDAARRAMRDAEDAKALADYSRMTR